ncbi:MAG TPA: adenylate/guanylate cyclase domain-containing protein [Anaerolineae bacterium]|nr:adenylate/guanylate cyclase domain-containing protein [Anaerolineae bacterium]
MKQRELLEQAITLQESMRGKWPDEIIDMVIEGLQEQLATGQTRPTHEASKQRKQATILFADVSGFTALSEKMDAEDVSDMMNGLWEVVDQAIIKHQGHIDKHIGDAVMALWGVDEARENDPEQAIKAALAMRQGVQDFAQKNQLPLQMRIGVHTGPVLFDQIRTTGEFTAMGDTVNTASRLEQAAPVGNILISQTTYQQVRGIFVMQAIEPLKAKGKEEALQVYLVTGLKPRTFRTSTRGVEGIETKTVGREALFSQMRAVYQRVITNRETSVITMVGEAGIGKSRLLYEFERWLAEEAPFIYQLKSRASLQTQHNPHFLLRDMLASYCQILDSDSLELVQQKFRTGLQPFLPLETEMKADIIGSWLGYDFRNSVHLRAIKDDPVQIKQQAIFYLTQFLSEAAATQPMVIFWEDIHWGDMASLKTLIDLCQRQPALPVLIVCLARPSLYERQAEWDEQFQHYYRLNIEPLSSGQTRSLLVNILRHVKNPPAALLDLIVQRAEGIPFYVEELIKMLVDEGVIVPEEKAWRVEVARLSDLQVPATLTGVLQARLDRLSAEEKEALQQAAVVGRVFWDDALRALNEEAVTILPHLQGKEFIFMREGSGFAHMAEYIFKHAILRDVTYETVLKRARRIYHGQVAAWLVVAAEKNGRSHEYAALIGEHFYRGEEEVVAAEWYGRAGQYAQANFAHDEAIRYLTFALQLMPATDMITRFEYLSAREKVYDLQGNRSEQQVDLNRMAELATQLSASHQAKVALRQADYATSTSDYGATVKHIEEAIDFAMAEQDKVLLTIAYAQWATTLWYQGQYELAQSKYEQGLILAQEINDLKQEAFFLHGLGNIAYNNGNIARAQSYHEEALAIRERISDRWGKAGSLSNLGLIANNKGETTVAIHYHKQALAIRQMIDDRRGEANSVTNLALVAINQGDYETAQAYLTDALALRRSINDLLGEGLTLAHFALVYHQLDEQIKAETYCQQAVVIARDIGSLFLLEYALTNLGHILLVGGDVSGARTAYVEAHAICQKTNQKNVVVPLAGLAQVALAEDDIETALAQAEIIYTYLNEQQLSALAVDKMLLYLTCYQIFVHIGDVRAEKVLGQAYQLLQTIASNQPEGLRSLYLAIPSHAKIIDLWERLR